MKPFEKYIDTFPIIANPVVESFRSLSNKGKDMTREEALQYIYKYDTSKLFCKEEIYSMESEKVEGVSTELWLPKKSLRIDRPTFTVIGFTSYDCSDLKTFPKTILTLQIIDKKTLNVSDSLVAYIGNEYDWDLTGSVNTKNSKILLFNETGKRISNVTARLYSFNSTKFKLIKEQKNVTHITDDLQQNVKVLRWEEDFSQ